jgi:hypothetical protein
MAMHNKETRMDTPAWLWMARGVFASGRGNALAIRSLSIRASFARDEFHAMD